MHALGDLGIARPGDVARALPVGRLEGRQRDPRLVGAGRRLDAHGEHIGAPAFRHGCVGRLRRGETRRKAKCTGSDAGFEDVTAIHLSSPSPMAVVPGRGRRPVGGTVRAIPDRSASHATAVCTGYPRIAGRLGRRQRERGPPARIVSGPEARAPTRGRDRPVARGRRSGARRPCLKARSARSPARNRDGRS